MSDAKDNDILPPEVDPDKHLLGVREIRATNAAEAKTVSRVRGFEVITDEKTGTNIGPSPLETVLSALVGCEGVIINRCARMINFAIPGWISNATAGWTAAARAGCPGSARISSAWRSRSSSPPMSPPNAWPNCARTSSCAAR